MYAVCVTFHIRPGHTDRFLARMLEQARDSMNREPGCHHFDVCYDSNSPETIFLYELYSDAHAFAEHNASAHFKAFASDVADWVVSKEVTLFDTVHLSGAE